MLFQLRAVRIPGKPPDERPIQVGEVSRLVAREWIVEETAETNLL